MFGIRTFLKKKFNPTQDLYHTVGNADLIFRSFANLGTPNPAFEYLFRENENNPESVDKDSAHVLYYLTKLIKAKVAIEVGVYRGAGSLHLSQALSENEGDALHIVDISPEYLQDVQQKLDSFGYKSVSHEGRSDDRGVLSNLPSADIIFLDADHGYESVKQDFENYWPLVKKDGLLVIHDTVMWPGARKVANEIRHQKFDISTLATSGGAGISIIRK